MTRNEFQSKLQSLSAVFVSFSPPDMDLRLPETARAYRGLFRKTDENKWKAVFGSESDCAEASVVLQGLGITTERLELQAPLCGLMFVGPEGT